MFIDTWKMTKLFASIFWAKFTPSLSPLLAVVRLLTKVKDIWSLLNTADQRLPQLGEVLVWVVQGIFCSVFYQMADIVYGIVLKHDVSN